LICGLPCIDGSLPVRDLFVLGPESSGFCPERLVRSPDIKPGGRTLNCKHGLNFCCFMQIAEMPRRFSAPLRANSLAAPKALPDNLQNPARQGFVCAEICAVLGFL